MTNTLHAVFSVKADSNLLKMVWECSDLKVSRWKMLHPSNTEDKCTIGLTSEDMRKRVWRLHPESPDTALVDLPLQRHNLLWFCHSSVQLRIKWSWRRGSLKHVKQQVSALLCGEDLPEGVQAREVTKAPYEVPAVPRGETTCPVCR